MVIRENRVTVAEFFDFIQQADNTNRDFELVEGRIIEVVSHGKSSEIAARIIGLLTIFLLKHNIGRITGADGGYMVGGNPYIPDVAFMSYARQPEPAYVHGYNVLAPELAVEVLSPTDTDITPKVVNYLNADTTVWVVNPQTKTITVYVPEDAPQTLTTDDTLIAGELLPEFSFDVSDAFPEKP